MRTGFALFAAMLCATVAQALALGQLSDKDSAGGLKEALVQGAGRAVDMLGRNDGFLGNPRVRIALPRALEGPSRLMRSLGMGAQVDELETAMNRAAEVAVPEARGLLVGAVKSMSVDDAKGILTGGDNAATEYFRRRTSASLAEKFKPIVRKAMTRVKLAEKYEQVAGQAAGPGLLKGDAVHLDAYVTDKALDGLYLMIGEEEKAIRANPVSAAGKLARKVFGALGR